MYIERCEVCRVFTGCKIVDSRQHKSAPGQTPEELSASMSTNMQ